ncbi:MAG: hypothetical protein U0234_18930 [Sandaracinus sp.]
MRLLVVLLAAALGSCAADDSLSVQLVSNLSPSSEVDAAHVIVTRESAVLIDTIVPIAPSASLGRPRRLVDLAAGGRVSATVELRWRGATVLTRHVTREVVGRTVVSVLMTRDCQGVSCPGAADATAVECLGGRCVSPECDEEHPELCDAECHVDADCLVPSAACAPARCTASGTCVALPDDERCDVGEVCDAALGCVAGGASCVLGPWGAPTSFDVLNTASTEFGPEPSTDGLRLYFDSSRSGNEDLYLTQRPSRDASFLPPTPITELSTASDETDPSLTEDELDLFFTSDRDGAFCIYEVRRASRDAAWGTPVRLSALCPTPISGAHVSDDGLRLYFNTEEDAWKEGTIYVATRTSRDAPFSERVAVPGLPAGHIGFAWLSADELTIYFERDEPGYLQGNFATRTSVEAPFENVQPLAGLELLETGDVALSADGRELFFARSGAQEFDLLVMRRDCQ